MKTVGICTFLRGVVSSKIALAAIAICAAFAARAANYWKGADGADIADAANWDEGLPTAAIGYFNGKAPHGTDYTATLGQDLSLYRLTWGGSSPYLNSMVLDLGGHVLTLTLEATSEQAQPIRIERDNQSVTITNGTLTTSKDSFLLNNYQTLTLGEGLTFNGNIVVVAAQTTPGTGSRIVVKDGAKVNGKLTVQSYQSEAEILVTGADTAVNFGSNKVSFPTADSVSNSTFRVADGATVNSGTGDNFNVATLGTGMTLSVESGAMFKTGDGS